MKLFNKFATAFLVSLSSMSFGGTCDEVFSNISLWLVEPENFVRVVTTFHKENAEVAYTSGLLTPDTSFPDFYTALSTRYFNDGVIPAEQPFTKASSDNVTIQIRKSNPDAAQVNYKIDQDPAGSVAYLGQCTGNMIHVIQSTGGVLTLSFLFDYTN